MGCTGCSVESNTIKNRKTGQIEPPFITDSCYWTPESSTKLIEYNLKTNSWAPHELSMKNLKRGVPAFDHFFTTAMMKQGVYVFGGMTNDRKFMRQNIFICTETFQLREKAEMSIAKCNMGVGIIHIKNFLVVGGNNERVIAETCLYDTERDEWSGKPHLNIPRYCPGVCLFSSKYLYVFGGCTIEITEVGEERERTLCSIEVFNLTRTDTVWKLVPIYLSEWKGGMDCGCCQSSPNEILICGGLRDEGTVELSSEVHILNINTQTISRSNSLKERDMFIGGLYYIDKNTVGGFGYSGLFHSCNLLNLQWTLFKAPNASPNDPGAPSEQPQK